MNPQEENILFGINFGEKKTVRPKRKAQILEKAKMTSKMAILGHFDLISQ